MSEKMTTNAPGFECVDPQWGDQLVRMHEADLAPAVRQGLENHLFICDACRLSQQVESAVGEATRAGRVIIKPGKVSRHLPFPLLRWAGPTTIAASLALLFLLPPTGRGSGGVQRDGESAPKFERPVEGEIVWGNVPELKWSPIEGATSYRVVISEVGGDFKWTGSTDWTRVQMSAEHPLPDDGIFRGVVHPVPADLARPTAVTVAFSRSGWREYFRYRVGAAPGVVKGLAGAGFGVWVFGLFVFEMYRRRAVG
ncbi:MAG: hypothetical protein ACI9UK_001618 [Candidatus Krumholzibacteriia bacterium]|jgi:hypothetical protein